MKKAKSVLGRPPDPASIGATLRETLAALKPADAKMLVDMGVAAILDKRHSSYLGRIKSETGLVCRTFSVGKNKMLVLRIAP